MPKRPPTDVSTEFAALRRFHFAMAALEFVVLCAILVAWMLLLMPHVHIWWMLVPMLPLHLVFRRIAKRKSVCPACRTSLLDDDGFSAFAKACEHCGARFR